jgi:hypothetical protein
MSPEQKQMVLSLKRNKEMLDSDVEKYLRSQGWRQEMVGYFWIWKRQCAGEQFTGMDVASAYAMQSCIDELEWNK